MKKTDQWTRDLQAYIARTIGGGQRLASDLGISESTVSLYKRGHRLPNFGRMLDIQKITDGAVMAVCAHCGRVGTPSSVSEGDHG